MAINEDSINTETVFIKETPYTFSRTETEQQITTLLSSSEKNYQGVFNKATQTLSVYELSSTSSHQTASLQPVFEIVVDTTTIPTSTPIQPCKSNVDYFFARIFYSTEPSYSYIKYDDKSYDIHIKNDRYVSTPANTPTAIAQKCETFKEKAVQADTYFDGAVAATTSTVCPTDGSIKTVSDVVINAFTKNITYKDWIALIITGVSSLPHLQAFGQLMSAADATAQWSLLFSCMNICRDSFDYVAARY